MDALIYDELNPGIANLVRSLRLQGFKTTDSGDGVSKHPNAREFHVPHVVCVVKQTEFFDEAERLQYLLGAQWRVEASYAPQDGSCILLATKGLGE